MAFDPRKLRHRVDIERPLVQVDGGGNRVTTWEAVAKDVPAEIVALSVREFISSQAMQSQIVARITIRTRPGLDAAMRIVHNGTVYNPQGWLPDPDSMQSYVTAPCTAGTNDG